MSTVAIGNQAEVSFQRQSIKTGGNHLNHLPAVSTKIKIATCDFFALCPNVRITYADPLEYASCVAQYGSFNFGKFFASYFAGYAHFFTM